MCRSIDLVKIIKFFYYGRRNFIILVEYSILINKYMMKTIIGRML